MQICNQAVLGEGSVKASEDLEGHPFVGPAGKLLAKALSEAGIAREECDIINAVKHFKSKLLPGKRRLDQKLAVGEIKACRPWLLAEFEVFSPKIVVCLGATAVLAVSGKAVKMGENRGKFSATEHSPYSFVTVHPSSLLRAPDKESREQNDHLFICDLKALGRKLREIAK